MPRLLASALAQASPKPQAMSTEVLRSYCSSADTNWLQLCGVYILGVVHGLQIGLSPDFHKKVWCIKDGLSGSELVNAFMSSSSALKNAYPVDMKLTSV